MLPADSSQTMGSGSLDLPQHRSRSHPSRARQEVCRDGSVVVGPLAHCAVTLRIRITLIRPVDEEWLADQRTAGNEPKIPAIAAVVAVVAHHEERTGRDGHRRNVLKLAKRRLDSMHDIRLVELLIIDVDIAVANFESCLLYTSDAADERSSVD